MATKAKEHSLANILARELGYKDAKELKAKLGGGSSTSVAENIKGRLRSGEGFFSSITGGISDTGEAVGKKINPVNVGKDIYKNLISGDNVISAYLQGRGKGKKEKETTPTPESTQQGGLTEDSVTYLQILAKNSMSIPWMARDLNVLRQNIIKLTKLKGGKDASTNKADAWFLKEDEREAALEAQKNKIQGPKPAGEKEGGGEGGGGIIDTIMKFFSGGFMKAIRFIFNPKMLGTIFSKVFLPIAIIGTLFQGITAGFKKYQETGDLTDAIVSGLGGMLEFVTFGLFGEDTLKTLWESISNFFKPVTEAISNIFNGIKDFVKNLFPGLGGTDNDVKAEAPKPTSPDTSKFTAESKSDGPKTPTSDAMSKADTAKKLSEEGTLPPSETSPTPTRGLEAPMSAAPVTNTDASPAQAPTAPTPLPSGNLSTPDQIKQIQSYIDTNEQNLANKEKNARERIDAFKKAHPNEPEKVAEFIKQEQASLDTYKKQIDSANEQHKTNIINLAKSPQAAPSAPPAPPPSGAASQSPSESSSGGSAPSIGGGTPPSAEGGTTAPSGSQIDSASAAVAEAQRMESSADQGTVINAPNTTNNTSRAGKEPTQIADVYDSEFAKLIAA